MLEAEEFKTKYYEIPDETRQAFFKAFKRIDDGMVVLESKDQETYDILSGNMDVIRFAKVLSPHVTGISLMRLDLIEKEKIKLKRGRPKMEASENQNKKDERFVRFVTEEHVKILDAWCEYTGKSIPKSIVHAIELAKKYEKEIQPLKDELAVWKLMIKEYKHFFGASK